MIPKFRAWNKSENEMKHNVVPIYENPELLEVPK